MASNRQPKPINSTNEVVLNGIISVISKGKNEMWIGTMTQLSNALSKNLSQKGSKLLPGSPAALRVVVNRVISRLRNRGIGVRFTRTTDHMRTRIVKFAR